MRGRLMIKWPVRKGFMYILDFFIHEPVFRSYVCFLKFLIYIQFGLVSRVDKIFPVKAIIPEVIHHELITGEVMYILTLSD